MNTVCLLFPKIIQRGQIKTKMNKLKKIYSKVSFLDKNGFFIGNHQIDLVKEITYLHEVLN